MHVSDFMTRRALTIEPDASLDDAMDRMDAEGVRHLPVVEGDRVVGVLSERDLLETTGWLPERVREVLEAPSGVVRDFMHAPVVSVSPQSTVVTAALRLVEWNIGCLPVLEDGRLVGIVTDSDLLRVYSDACRGDTLAVESDPTVEEVMTTDVVSATPDTPAEDALAFCREKKVRHLPLVEGDELVGIVSDRDLRRCVGRGDLEGTTVGDLASDSLITVDPDSRLSSATEVLLDNDVGAVPVVEGLRVTGLVSTKDVLQHCARAFVSAREST